jgi:chromosome segregation protein
MRLSKLKIAGFKSFVDLTTAHFPQNLTGVVGPNGCGKSNIIDAVRWVMGEISAKHLRGESMNDIIFNGSNTRKPVGTASVELVFDNSDGAITGPYAAYSEVSLKRQVSRDGTSTYFINGAKCRRKDITQLFLGTGLGSRSYAIIEQGMISRLITAKPDEMRGFIEEAAGISRYKERRKETESRIAQTRENLERLNDLREEVEKQLRHLQRQAATARRYQGLKEEERKFHAELLALRLRDLDAEAEGRGQAFSSSDLALQSAVTTLRAAEADVERARESSSTRQETLNGVQGRYYQHGAEVTRTEQSLQFARDLRARQRTDLEQATQAQAEAEAVLARDQGQVDGLTSALAELEPGLLVAREAEAAAHQMLEQSEGGLATWQQGWETYTRDVSGANQRAMVERARIEQLDNSMRRLLQQQDKVQVERDTLGGTSMDEQLAALAARELEAAEAGRTAQERLQQLLQDHQQIKSEERRLQAELDRARSELQRTRGQVVSLEALQQAALGQVKGRVVEWLKGHSLDARPRLAQQLSVESGWERAVETVLGAYLEAVCVDGLDAVADLIDGLQVGQVSFITPAAGGSVTGLAAKVTGTNGVPSLLSSIHAVDSLGEALSRRASLQPGESVITRDGVWIGRDWLRVSRDKDEHAGVIGREGELRKLRDAVREAEAAVANLEQSLEEARAGVKRTEDDRDDLQAEVNRLHRTHLDSKSQLDSLRARAQQTADRLQRLTTESEDLAREISEAEEAVRAARQRLDEAMNAMQALEDRRPALEAERDERRAAVSDGRQAVQAARGRAQEAAIQVESRRSTLASVTGNLTRLRTQLEQLQARQTDLTRQLAEGEEPITALEQQLEVALQRRLEVEQELQAARAGLEEAETALRTADEQRLTGEQAVEAARAAAESARLAAQEIRVRRESIAEQFTATKFDLAAVLGALPEESNVPAWETSLADVTGRIERLGQVNLAAIDEFKEQSERKDYLDKQFADLTEALNTLEQAMRKIDRETRSRFQDTFDRINAGMQERFPKLFGGGSAYLELVGEDVLEAGVAVMARPPGKRNSTINQLSGGEKALTAVALVFSIFDLNPAPFCMLDEVDAPLDDHNVGRFCDVVKEMSERVQFIFITHKPHTMELAQNLLGVTMHEPGVSRLVAVDVDEALRMTASESA